MGFSKCLNVRCPVFFKDPYDNFLLYTDLICGVERFNQIISRTILYFFIRLEGILILFWGLDPAGTQCFLSDPEPFASTLKKKGRIRSRFFLENEGRTDY